MNLQLKLKIRRAACYIGTLVHQQPVIASFTVAILICSIPVMMVLGQQNDIKKAVDGNTSAVKAIETEGAERRDQTCTLNERDHKADVEALSRTYEYLGLLSGRQINTPFNQFIIRSLPRAEAEAKIDVAPEFCDEKNVGLPEPDPVIPSRPSAIDDLIRNSR